MLKYLDCLYMLTSVFSDYEFVRIRGRNATETSWLIEILRRLLCIRFHSDRRCRGGRWVWRIVHIYLSLFVTNCGLATDNMLQIIEAHPNWPVCADVFEHSSPRLASQRPIWSDITSVCQHNYAMVRGLVVGFCGQPHYCYWPYYLIARFRSPLSYMVSDEPLPDRSVGPCHANLHKWSLAQSPSYDCGQQQTMNHIVDTCPLTKFKGGLNLLHEADEWWCSSHMARICSDWSTRKITNCGA